MTEEETAQYLSLTSKQFSDLLSYEERQRISLIGAGITNYDTYRFIPYVQIDGRKYFSIDQIKEWVKYNTLNGEIINTGK